jgi:hypothetical protein
MSKQKHLILALGLAAMLQSVGCSKTASIAFSVPVETAPLVLPGDIGPILVLVDHLPGNEDFVEARAEQVAIGLRHFTGQTSWEYVDTVALEKVRSAAAVIYLGLNGNDLLSVDALARLRRAHHLIVSRYHLARLRQVRIAFQHTEGGKDVPAPPNTTVHYKGQTFPSALPDVSLSRSRNQHVLSPSTPSRTRPACPTSFKTVMLFSLTARFPSILVTWPGVARCLRFVTP